MVQKDQRSVLAPGAGAEPPAGDPLPVDERLAPPETRIEYIGGVEYFAAPSDEPHGKRHHKVDYVVGAHVAKGYGAAVDMLTRTAETSDFAPDVSIYPDERNPATGRRKLEEIAIEVTSEQAIEGKIEAVLAVLASRALPVPDEQRAETLACRDIATVERWVRSAALVASAEDLLRSDE